MIVSTNKFKSLNTFQKLTQALPCLVVLMKTSSNPKITTGFSRVRTSPEKMMMTTDEQLQKLIARICGNPKPKLLERRRAMNRLLSAIQKLPGLLKSSHLDYLEALDLTWEWLSRHVCEFEPRLHESMQTSLVRWINGYLSWRIRDLYRREERNQCSLDDPIDNSKDNPITWLEQMSDNNIPVLSGIDGYFEQLQNQERQNISLKLELYIEEDPEKKLRSCHPLKYPDCHCRFLSQRLLLQNPPARFADISRELGINYQTLKSHWEKKCKPLLQEIATALGYQRE